MFFKFSSVFLEFYQTLQNSLNCPKSFSKHSPNILAVPPKFYQECTKISARFSKIFPNLGSSNILALSPGLRGESWEPGCTIGDVLYFSWGLMETSFQNPEGLIRGKKSKFGYRCPTTAG